jgi:CO dehydrogenase nickel-insertion accessory protein CooC1
MSNTANIVNRQQVLDRLCREGSQGINEIAVVTSPGARATAWAVKIKSISSYNVYNVVAVVINDAGSEPTEIGQQTQAVNMAESFTQTGTLPTGTYAVMARVGNKNVFHVKP